MYLFDYRKKKSESNSYRDDGTAGSDNSVKDPNCDDNVVVDDDLVPNDEDVVAGHESVRISKGYGK